MDDKIRYKIRIVNNQLHADVGEGDWIQLTSGGQLYATTLGIMIDHGVNLSSVPSTGMITMACVRIMKASAILSIGEEE